MEGKIVSVLALCMVAVLMIAFGAEAAAAPTMMEKCSGDFEKVVACLSFATGKAATPTKECCTSVTEIKDSHPACLCYIMQQTHNGSDQIKSMGVQEARLLQLPTACKLANASLSECPKLLNIPASSPDYKIFTDPSVSTPTLPSTSSPTGTTKSPASNGVSSRTKVIPQLAGFVSIAMAIKIIFYITSP